MRIGIDLGGTKTEGILMSDKGEVLKSLRTRTPADEGYQAILDNISRIAHDLERGENTTCRIGIGTPGSLSAHDGTLRNSNTTCLNDKPLLDDLRRLLDRPIRIENDANCFVLSEAVDGAASTGHVVFGIIMGTGVGGGLVVNRQLIHGINHIAGEWGHNVLNAEGPRCYCGRQGCVETFLSGPGIVKNYDTKIASDYADAKSVFAAAENGESAAGLVVNEFLKNFGRAVATVVNIIDPDIIVIGGGLSHVEALYTTGRHHVAEHVFSEYFDTPIVKNRFGDSSGVRGAAWLWPVD